MKCEECQAHLVDVLYGERLEPRVMLEFFRHLGACSSCETEYLELTETRERLAEWVPDGAEMSGFGEDARIVSGRFGNRMAWWPLLQKVAATVLILAGLLAVLQGLGIWSRPATGISEDRLAEMVHDIVVARQVEDWKVIGSALLNLKEEIEAKNRVEMRGIYEDLYSLEQRYVQALEENNQRMRTLISR